MGLITLWARKLTLKGVQHQAYDLAIPENVAILFQPAYSPQVNPIEGKGSKTPVPLLPSREKGLGGELRYD